MQMRRPAGRVWGLLLIFSQFKSNHSGSDSLKPEMSETHKPAAIVHFS